MLQFREKTPCGGLTAWGISFDYEYNPTSKKLEVVDTRHKTSLFQFDYCSQLSSIALNFITTLEKTTQIQALSFSQGRSVALCDMYDGIQLVSLVKRAIRLSEYALQLQRGHYVVFNRAFAEHHNLEEMSVCRFESSMTTPAFFRVAVQSTNYSSCKATHTVLHNAINIAANKVATEMASREYAKRLEKSARGLVNAATELRILAKILDESYVPHNNLEQRQTQLKNMENKIKRKISF